MTTLSWIRTKPPNLSWKLYPYLMKKRQKWRAWRSRELVKGIRRKSQGSLNLNKMIKGKVVNIIVLASPPPPKSCTTMRMRGSLAISNQLLNKTKIAKLNKTSKPQKILLQTRLTRARSRIMRMIRNELMIWQLCTLIRIRSHINLKFDNFGNDFKVFKWELKYN